uniref:Uncharacterized protein n=1 Tax=Anguilla anguilla TaxID=7936 RepID=A0A0E9UP67_ANGAN
MKYCVENKLSQESNFTQSWRSLIQFSGRGRLKDKVSWKESCCD